MKAAESNDSIKYTQTLNELGLKTSRLFQPPQLLFTIAANIGDTAILDYPSCFPDSIVALIPHDKKLSLEYLNTYLTLIKPYIEDLAPYSAQKNLNNQQLAQVPVIIPPQNIQANIVAKMDVAYASKKQKETEAQALLDSIDAYLLGELGIELPKQEENTIQSRMFTRTLSEVSGDRLDPAYYQSKYINITNAIQSSHHDKLKHIVNFSSEVWNQKDGFTSKFPYIEIGEIDLGSGEIKRINYIDIIEAPSRAKMVVRNGDILVSTTRPSRGAIVCVETSEDILIASTGFAVIREIINTNIRRLFLHYILRHLISLKQMEQRSSGGNYPAITQDELGNLLVPTPSLEKQNEIIEYIGGIRQQAKQLKQEAKEGLAQAKSEVEAMILGDNQ